MASCPSSCDCAQTYCRRMRAHLRYKRAASRAGVGVVVLTGFPWTEYARLLYGHEVPPCGPGSEVCQHLRGHFLRLYSRTAKLSNTWEQAN
jgi:hypothetical protein